MSVSSGLARTGSIAAAQYATVFVVDSTSDLGDSNTADGLCQNTTLPSGAQCTLRAAIQQANAIVEAATTRLPRASGHHARCGGLPSIHRYGHDLSLQLRRSDG